MATRARLGLQAHLSKQGGQLELQLDAVCDKLV